MNSKLAFVFPGQGSQSVAMLNDLAEHHTIVRQTCDSASEVLGYDLWTIISEGPAEELNKTHITQPAMLAAGVAIWRLWKSLDGDLPGMIAGHSLGEYTALVCAEAIKFEDAIKLVETRGRYMQEAVPEGSGAMAAILGLDDEKVKQVCGDAAEGDVVTAVNFNSPGQVVIAGNTAAVERATVLAKEAGAKRAIMLPVSVPSHCSLMMAAADRMKALLQNIEISKPVIPVINNVDVANETSAEGIRAALVKQLYNPVRWVETVQKMVDGEVEHIVECGPGKVLMGLNKRISKQVNHYCVFDTASLEKTLASFTSSK